MAGKPAQRTRNVLHVLINGSPEEWALSRNVPEGEDSDVITVRFENVPDELADQIEESGKVKHFWDELMRLPHQTL